MLDRRRAVLLTAAVAALVYANALGNGFAYDDVPIIEENAAIQSLEALPGAIVSSYWPGTRGENASLWRPVTTAAFGVQYVLGGGSPLLFHAVNVVLHAAASVGVLLFLAYLMPLAGAFTAAIVFALHPVHVEAVANVVGFAELFSTVALLAALLVYVRAPARVGWGAALGMGVLYALAFGAKESAVVLPGLVFLVDAARRRLALSDLRAYLADRWRVYLVLLVVALALLAARVPILGRVASPTGPMGADLLYEIPRIWTVAQVWTHYVRLWVFPLDLSADYAPNVIPVALGWNATNVVGVVLALTILATAWVAWRRPELRPERASARVAGFGVMWFVIAISPVSNTLFLSGVTLAERTLYLPSVGLAAVSGWLLVVLLRERRALGGVVVALAVVLSAARTWTRTPTWHDTPSVFLTMLREVPHSGRAQWMLGDNFWMQGDTAQALATYRHAVNLLDGHYRLLVAVGGKLMERERYGSAERLVRRAWKDNPERPRAPRVLASIRAELGDAEGTERFARRALAIVPEDPVREHLLAWALAAQGSWSRAAEARRRADALGVAAFWQPWLYEAYARRRAGDPEGVRMALDSARATVRTDVGRAVLDSILRHDFGVEREAATHRPGR
ncbi:MAG: hypothetical protein U5R14_04300 [Gemmatimonadota bacterium]|nr:hypothetical protein [Gemmatimonadota bacterium]